MGILNATPDSFSDGGKFRSPKDAIAQAERMIVDGLILLILVVSLRDQALHPLTCKKNSTECFQ